MMQGDVGKSVEGSIGDEVGGVKNVRQNRVSPDRQHPKEHLELVMDGACLLVVDALPLYGDTCCK